MRLGDESDSGDPGDDDDISDGESIYSVLCAALTQATGPQQLEIAGALLKGLGKNGEPTVAFDSLSEETRELFEAAGETLFEDEDDEDIGPDEDEDLPTDEG